MAYGIAKGAFLLVLTKLWQGQLGSFCPHFMTHEFKPAEFQATCAVFSDLPGHFFLANGKHPERVYQGKTC